jgi:hypothetical protein
MMPDRIVKLGFGFGFSGLLDVIIITSHRQRVGGRNIVYRHQRSIVVFVHMN